MRAHPRAHATFRVYMLVCNRSIIDCDLVLRLYLYVYHISMVIVDGQAQRTTQQVFPKDDFTESSMIS